MRSWRILGFALAIAFGVIAGLLGGWLLFPAAAQPAVPSNLRADYQADMVLMTAEVFARDDDLPAAVARLQLLDAQNPMRVVQSAILTAQQLGYSQADMQILAHLITGLQSYTPVPTETAP